MPLSRQSLLAAFAVLIATACADTPDAADEPAPEPLELAGTRWVLSEEGPAQRRPQTVEFSAGDRANGSTGCNNWFAQVDQSDGGLTFSAIGMTKRACPEPAMSMEREFAAMLAATRGAQRDGEDLLFFGGGRQLARFSPQR